MSRLAGMIAGDDRPTREPVLKMLAASSSRAMAESATSHTSEGRRATVGSWGWGPDKVAARGPLVAAIDGHIYNRADLGATAGEHDAALLLRLYERHGFADMLRQLNGDFAVAIADSTKGTLWLGRDRFGVKPLYYHEAPGWLAFASRPRGLLALPGVSSEPNRRFVACFAGSHYRTFDNEPAESPYAAIAQLPAGHLLQWRDGRASVAAWWTLSEQPDLRDDEATLAERYRDLLFDALRLRLPPMRGPAFTLSGGMDSSTVLGCAVRESGTRQVAYSSVYEDPTYDETAEIQSMLSACVSDWRQVKVGDPDLASVVARMIEANDEPVATATWLSHFLLCQQAHAEGVGSLFGGLGGDELNAGEYEYFYYFFADLEAAGEHGLLERETAKWIQYHDHPIFKKSFQAMRSGLERLVDLRRPGHCLPDPARLARYRDTVHRDYFDLHRFLPVMDHPFTSYLKNRTYQDIFRETAPCCLRAADRQTTEFGLDVCWPFFDHRLVELMFRVPATLKIRAGVTKHLLREATKGVLPEETRTRVKKTGWNAPAHVWFSGPGRELLMDLVGSSAFAARGIYDVARVRAIIDQHQEIVASGQPLENHMMFLWQLVNLELWLRALPATSG